MELNHRIKINLGMVGSPVGLKSKELKGQVDLSDLQRQIEAIERVYEKLARSDSLGLQLIQALINQVQGRIRLRKEPFTRRTRRRGTSTTLTLPPCRSFSR